MSPLPSELVTRRQAIATLGKVGIGVVAAAALGTGGYYAYQSSVPKPVEVKTVSFSGAPWDNIQYMPHIAAEKIFLPQTGYVLDHVLSQTVSVLNTLLGQGRVYSGEINIVSVTNARLQGVPLKIFLPQRQLLFYLMAKPSVTSLKDLEGKALGILSPGSQSDIFTRFLLKDAGVDLSKVNFVSVGGGADRYAALVAGKIDASLTEIDIAIQAQKSGFKFLQAVKIPKSIAGFGTHEAIIKDHPDALYAWTKALMQGFNWAYGDKKAVLDLAALRIPGDPQVLSDSYDIYVKELGWPQPPYLDKDAYNAATTVLVNGGLLNQVLPFEDVYDTSFIQKARKELGL